MLLRPFVYQPKPWPRDNDPDRSGLWQLVLLVTVVVIVVCVVVTAFAADLPVRRRVPDPRCNTGARYEAMREAYERRLPDPCNGATIWRR